MRFGLIAIGVGSVAVAAIAAACQTYDFEPVQPLALTQDTEGVITSANPLKANVMLVVDKSGSMLYPVDTNNTNCASGCGPQAPCGPNCPTRLSEMKGAMVPFLSGPQGDIARFGLAVFPLATSNANACTEGGIDKDIPSTDDGIALAGAASTIGSVIQAIGAGGYPAIGGTPTAATLTKLETYAPLLDSQRANIALLLTDGLPNCNGSLNGATCACVQAGTCSSTSSLNCLDTQATLGAINSLRSKSIKTMVVGFGAETAAAGVAFDTLNAMADAGGMGRQCTSNADCGAGDTCSAGSCGRRFYQAGNSAELAAVLQKLAIILIPGDPCNYHFSTPPRDPSFIVVYVDSQKIAPGADTWTYDPATQNVQLQGSLCTKVQTTDKLTVQVSALNTL
jgi:hypothetical protein